MVGGKRRAEIIYSAISIINLQYTNCSTYYTKDFMAIILVSWLGQLVKLLMYIILVSEICDH